MTVNVQLKRAITSLFLVSILVSCGMWNSWFGRESINLGEYITLEVESPEEGHSYLWIFAQLPDSSKLLGLLPSDTLLTVSFKPDFAGDYDVVLQVTTNGEVEETSYFYEAMIPENSEMINPEIPDHLLETLNTEDTTVSDTPDASLTDQGAQRRYLDKVISPDQPTKSTKKRRATRSSKSTTQKAPAKVSRGNLIPLAAKTFTIQVSSWPSLDEAQHASQELKDNYGIESYIQRAFFKDKDEIYYRLRVGNFQESIDAEAYAKEIQSMTTLPVWVDFVRQEM